jgi:hypothetical protein
MLPRIDGERIGMSGRWRNCVRVLLLGTAASSTYYNPSNNAGAKIFQRLHSANFLCHAGSRREPSRHPTGNSIYKSVDPLFLSDHRYCVKSVTLMLVSGVAGVQFVPAANLPGK